MIPLLRCLLPRRFPASLSALAAVVTAIAALGLTPSLGAHQPGNSSLVLRYGDDGRLFGEYHVADVDLESLRLMLEDRQPDGDAVPRPETLPWLEIEGAAGPVDFVTGPAEVVTTDGAPHTMIPFVTDIVPGELVTVRFEDFFAFDSRHRVVTSLEREAGGGRLGLLTRDSASWEVSLATPGPWQQFLTFTWEGVFHIWIGIDHILFLIALLLPSVLRRQDNRWVPVHDFHEAMMTVIKVVTAFTVAHSVTLSLAALEIVSLPSKWVETVIALSVVLAALNNVFPIVRSGQTWVVALGFGFIHGFGFANVLADLQLPAGTLALALLSFNIGVELGQIAIVLVVFPVIYMLCRRPLYLPVILQTGSVVIALIATAWVFDRVFELEMMPF